MDKVTYDDVYEIAAEVAEETIKKFLQNLVKLVPAAEDVVDDIKESQYEELKRLKQAESQQEVYTSKRAKIREQARSQPIIPMDDDDEEEDEFAAIAHPSKAQNVSSLKLDEALSQIPLESSDLYGGAASSPVDDSQIVPCEGLDA
jgi:DNA repair photolyase